MPLVAAAPAQAAASTTIGQVASTTFGTCVGQSDDVQTSVPSGPSYEVPPLSGGVQSWMVSSWSTRSRQGDGQMLKFKVFRRLDATTFTAIAHDGPRPIAPEQLNTFPVSVPVLPGDFIGLNSANAADVPNSCFYPTSQNGDVFSRIGDLADGETATFSGGPEMARINVSAVVEPSNLFALGRLVRNARKGTAVEKVSVPNPGTLTVSGKGVRRASAGAITAISVKSAGTVKLPIRAKGKQRRRLNSKGAVELRTTITYTPTDGTTRSTSLGVKLKKKI